jgi:hypothetical protein
MGHTISEDEIDKANQPRIYRLSMFTVVEFTAIKKDE